MYWSTNTVITVVMSAVDYIIVFLLFLKLLSSHIAIFVKEWNEPETNVLMA